MAAEQSSLSRSRSTVISLTKYIPYPEISHAGGQYLLAHDRALSPVFEVRHLAPNTPLNRDALEHQGVVAHNNQLIGPRLQGLWFKWLQFESVWAGGAVYWPIRRLFRTGRAPWSELAEAQIIEFQWSEMIALAPLVRRRLPGALLVGVAHDVISQWFDRESTSARSRVRRWLLQMIATRTRARESASFRALDVLVVFSSKDAELARELAPELRVEVVHPAVGSGEAPTRVAPPQSATVLFVGAMNRPENEDAVTWFMIHVWPHVLAAVPSARFVIAGAHPTPRLTKLVAESAQVELTGFVHSFDQVYADASVSVVPLRSGAGVKFKTVEAMMQGVPVVTTTVGAEGIDAQQLLTAIEDGPDAFAAAVVTQLRTPNTKLAQQAQEWAQGVYGVKAFSERVTGLYAEVANG